MSSLESSQRRVVRHGAFDLFCSDHPDARWQVRVFHGVVGVIAMAFAEYIRRAFIPHQWWLFIPPLIAAAAVLVFEILFQLYLRELLRTYFRRYIEGHQDKTSRAA